MNRLVGEKLRMIRAEKKLSQEKAAELAGMSRPTYRRYESGQIAKTEGLNQIAKAFGVGVYEILSGTADNEGEGLLAADSATIDDARSLLLELRGLGEVDRQKFFAYMRGYLAALRLKGR